MMPADVLPLALSGRRALLARSGSVVAVTLDSRAVLGRPPNPHHVQHTQLAV